MSQENDVISEATFADLSSLLEHERIPTKLELDRFVRSLGYRLIPEPSQDKVQKIKDTIQQAWCDGDSNPKDKFGDFLNRAAQEINKLFAIPELTLLTDKEIENLYHQWEQEYEDIEMTDAEWEKKCSQLLAQAQLTKNKRELGL